jgi:hypothetical protein
VPGGLGEPVWTGRTKDFGESCGKKMPEKNANERNNQAITRHGFA